MDLIFTQEAVPRRVVWPGSIIWPIVVIEAEIPDRALEMRRFAVVGRKVMARQLTSSRRCDRESTGDMNWRGVDSPPVRIASRPSSISMSTVSGTLRLSPLKHAGH